MEAKEIMADGRNDERQGMLLGLQVVELIDEALELGHGVVALVSGEIGRASCRERVCAIV